ncbi:MAG: DUF362 domain-containing protein [Ignisphaera sp.]
MSVAVIRSSSHVDGVRRVLELIANEITATVRDRQKFLIKPNFVSATTYLAATPLETVEAILDFIYSRFSVSEVVVAESPTIGSFREAIRNFGYHRLRERYSIEFIDLDDYEQKRFELKDEHGGVYEVYVSKLLLDKSFVRISPCRAKTHDTVVVTLSIKNIVMGAIKRGWKHRMHRGYLAINYNIAKLATYLMPDIGVVDGVEAMEGNGPVSGIVKRWGAVFASVNPVNLDAVASYAMGFNPSDIGYLYFLSRWGYGEIDVSRINIVGDNIESIKTVLKPHSTYRDQLIWKKNLDRVSKLE